MALTITKAIKRRITQIVGIVSLDADGNVVTDSNGNPAGNVVVSPATPDYVLVPASSTAYNLGAADDGTGGAAGDYLSHVIIGMTGATSAIVIFDGTTEVFWPGADLHQAATVGWYWHTFEINAYSKNGDWNITTGSAIRTCMAVGNFT